MQLTMADERMLGRMGISAGDAAADPHAACNQRWLDERGKREAAETASRIAWTNLEDRERQCNRLDGRVALWRALFWGAALAVVVLVGVLVLR